MSNETKKTLRTWIYGLSAAAITSVSTAGLSALGSSAMNNPINMQQLLTTCGIAGLIGAFAYLQQSPLPPEE